MLPVGVDGEDVVVGRELTGADPPGQVGEGLVIGGRHPPVVVEREQRGVGRAGQPLVDDLPGGVGRAVVDHHQLVDEGVEAVEDLFHRRFLVVGGDDGDAPAGGLPGSRVDAAHVQAR